jgi:hypothetical protein
MSASDGDHSRHVTVQDQVMVLTKYYSMIQELNNKCKENSVPR